MELVPDLLSIIATYAPWHTFIDVCTTSKVLASQTYLPYLWQQKSYYETRHLMVDPRLIPNWYLYWSIVCRTFSGHLYFANYNNDTNALNPNSGLREWELVTPYIVKYAMGYTIDIDSVRTILIYQLAVGDVYVVTDGRTSRMRIRGDIRRAVVSHSGDIYVLTDRGQIWLCRNAFGDDPVIVEMTSGCSDLVDIYYGAVSLVRLSRAGVVSYSSLITTYGNYKPFVPVPREVPAIVSLSGVYDMILIRSRNTTAWLLTFTGTLFYLNSDSSQSLIGKDLSDYGDSTIAYTTNRAGSIFTRSLVSDIDFGRDLFQYIRAPPAKLVSFKRNRIIYRSGNDSRSISDNRIPGQIDQNYKDIASYNVGADALVNVSGTIYFIGVFKY